jgi:DNA-binding NarL/FixJ family response regulator
MVTSTQKWTLDSDVRLKEWIGPRDANRASPKDITLLRRQLAIGSADGSEPPDEPPRPELAPNDGLRVAALDADERCSQPGDASVFWDDLVAGRAKRYCEWFGPTRSYAVALLHGEAGGTGRPLAPAEAIVILRVLCGQQQKVIATDLQIAHSTASKRYAQALDALDLNCPSVPLPLVLAAQTAARVVATTAARRSVFEHAGCALAVLSIPRPRIPGECELTTSEQNIALQLVEGRSRHEIAASRSTSVQTVSCQLRAVCAKLRLTGRYGAIRRGAELGWFDGKTAATGA